MRAVHFVKINATPAREARSFLDARPTPATPRSGPLSLLTAWDLMSAAQAVVHTKMDWVKFDRIISQCCRRALNGRFAVETQTHIGEISCLAWSNEKVRRFWRLPLTRTGALVRRLKWLQEVLGRLQVHCPVLAALFRRHPVWPHTPPTKEESSGRSDHGPTGLRRIYDHRDAVDGGEEFDSDVDGRWRGLFWTTFEAERFRARETTVALEQHEPDQ